MIKLFGAPAMPTVERLSVFFGLCFPLHEAAIAPPIGDHIEFPGNLEFLFGGFVQQVDLLVHSTARLSTAPR